jgi:Epoxide hydrolase N terminus
LVCTDEGNGNVGEHHGRPADPTTQDATIRPFGVDIPDEALDDLRRRLALARWPSRELVTDRSQGVQLATIQALTRYWVAETTCGGSRPG